jgi:hypothetical protein
MQAAYWALFLVASPAAEPAGTVLIPAPLEQVWRKPAAGWVWAENVTLDETNRRKLVPSGEGKVLVNGPGRLSDLVTKEEYTDSELHVEFLIAERSNSGVKMHGQYEIQIIDKPNAKELTGDSCGGIYPRAQLLPKYHHIDKGIGPKVDAARPAGEWQTLDIRFRGPRFDPDGKKTANAVFEKVVLNDRVIHENQEVETPTGHAYVNKEKAKGPILLQADHGPVAFRNVRIRALEAPTQP